MAEETLPEMLDRFVVEEVMRAEENIDVMMPAESILQSVLISSFDHMDAATRKMIVDKLGAEWYIELAAKIARDSRRMKNG